MSYSWNIALPNPMPARLAELGFLYDPFAYLDAAIMPEEILESTFVQTPGFDDFLRIGTSTVMLAKHGGGKTANRLYVSRGLRRLYHSNQGPQIIIAECGDALEELLCRCPDKVYSRDYFDPIMASVAESVFALLFANEERFLALQPRPRCWFWAFLIKYLKGVHISYRLEAGKLKKDFQEFDISSSVSPFHTDTYLSVAISSIVSQLNRLGINRLFFLVDGGHDPQDEKELESMVKVISPLIDSQSLSSLPNVTWKFFLPQALASFVTSTRNYATERLHLIDIKWDAQSLINCLNLRLQWASTLTGDSIENLCEQELTQKVDVSLELARMALAHRTLGPPRAILVLAKSLLIQSGTSQLAAPISVRDWHQFKEAIPPSLAPSGRTQRTTSVSEGSISKLLIDLTKLRDLLDSAFNQEDIRSLCFELGVDYDNIRGTIKRHKIEGLLDELQRDSRLPELLQQAQKTRRNAPWNDVYQEHNRANNHSVED